MADPADNPDRECNECGENDWKKFEERKPSHLPGNSDVIKHYYYCKNCSSHAYIYEEGGHTRYTGAFR